jgi:hypothetical protein
MLIFDTKIANFKPRMKQINSSKLISMAESGVH